MDRAVRQEQFYHVVGFYMKPRKGDGILTKRRFREVIAAESVLRANVAFRSSHPNMEIEAQD